ncbi:putative colanic acid biosynthesis acetyltransferase [Nonlabens ponticola]|uniref:Colanic acid biosynthesis acetyltransferase WcaF n=1 Tax=Nonlabens ponticola TaxID=2496866 RepID=A0A3S9MVF8_9FLAO|nr:putative colanic acid biosynthesis acetyltransferase [Nonlabens ponticola]AZQ43117.1 colanic acid biosynthesis acetyltransferase WcaF [Nonlabens ponticola]
MAGEKTYQQLDQFKLPPNFRGRGAVTVQLWWIVQSTLFACSPQFMYGWRRFLLRAFGANIGRNVIVRPTVKTQFPWKVTIGDHSWIGDEVILYSLGRINIGKNTVVSQRSYICTGTHDYNAVAFDIESHDITIGDQCWLATDVFVAPGLSIGDGSVIGARSSVFKNIPAGKICAGSPAVIIRNR